MNSQRQRQIDALLEGALGQAPQRRAKWLQARCGTDSELREAVERLLSLAASEDGFLDRSPFTCPLTATLPPAGEPARRAGQRLGEFVLVRSLGAGGMGEVWLGRRVEGGFEQTVAIKLLGTGSSTLLERFEAERSILADLVHPGIARLYGGGRLDDGQPYMVMEYVDGEDLLTWCEHHRTPLEQRLELFLEACDAVAHAHTHLVIHRDIKPANILVNDEGQVKLIDFGIAKLVQPQGLGDATLTAHLSPVYAAPEQLTGGRISTATDVHALGVTLYQLLTGLLPWQLEGLPVGQAVQRLVDTEPIPASQAATEGSPVPGRLLRGDLDAIIRRALRREPDGRYPDARSLAEDLRRHLRHEPVGARSGARLYVARRFVRRHWVPLASTALVFVTLLAGLVGVSHQQQLARSEAARATAIRDFLIQVFSASDPRIASDQPRGAISARELLDAATTRISDEFRDQAGLRVELLGLTADIYRELGEADRYERLHSEHLALAEALHGPLHPVVIEGRLRGIDDAILRHDYEQARALVDEADALIRAARLDDTAIRAQWWLRHGNSLENEPSRIGERIEALQNAAAGLALHAPNDWGHASARANLGVAHWESSAPGNAAAARDALQRAVEAADQVHPPNDGELQVILSNLGHVLTAQGDPWAADAAFSRAVELARRTYGERNRRYWHTATSWAGSLHARGERDTALRVFQEVINALPEEPGLDDQDDTALALTRYGGVMVRDGQPGAAIELLEAALRGYERANRGARLGYLHRMLADAYEGVGRHAEAENHFRILISQMNDESGPDGDSALAARERYGRFLLLMDRRDDARAEFETVLRFRGDLPSITTALAHAGLAELALAEQHPDAALESSRRALAGFEAIRAQADVRLGPHLRLVHARALAGNGDLEGARLNAQDAAADFRRFNHPESRALQEAESLLAQWSVHPDPE